jgi:DNA recombination protein RmuC
MDTSAVVAVVLVAALLVAVLLVWLVRSLKDVQVELRDVRGRVDASAGQSSAWTEVLGRATSDLSEARRSLAELHTKVDERERLEQLTAKSIGRLENIIAGTQTKGAAGENVVELILSKLPAEWQDPDFAVEGKRVEFALRLPNGLVLPIDSKWTATGLLEQFAAAEDPGERQRLKSQIESAVLSRTREVRKYIDPNRTVSFAVAAVPDAIYDLCAGVRAEVFRLNVVLVSYSMLVPYLLLVFQTILRTCQSIDLHKLDTYLARVEESIRAAQEEVEGRFARALTMLGNSREEMAAQLSKASSGLTSLELTASAVSSPELPPTGTETQSVKEGDQNGNREA